MTREAFAELADVSRETLAMLEVYLSLLKRWQRAINLVGPKTLTDPWRRHFLDSAQLQNHLGKNDAAIYDLGSGAGLPGLVLAILGKPDVHLVESDQRKVQFLREVVRVLGLNVEIHPVRIESLPDACADIVVARALAPLPHLLELSHPLLRSGAFCLFLKGQSATDELTDARKYWRMSSQSFPSMTEPSASVLKLWDIVRAPLHRQ